MSGAVEGEAAVRDRLPVAKRDSASDFSYSPPMWRNWKRLLIYGAVLGAGTLALQWMDYGRPARAAA